MSKIDDAFAQSRIDFGLKQKPNWNGTVYGSCQTKGCGNHRKVGRYEGGFCKKCSVRHPDDQKKFVLASNTGSAGMALDIPNPEIRWRNKAFVKDLSHKLSGSEREDFYMTPEALTKKYDSVGYSERFNFDEDVVEAKPTPKKKQQFEKGDWVE